MIRIETVMDIGVLNLYRDLMRTLPKTTQQTFKAIVREYTPKIRKELTTEPGRPRYPLRWKSARQRRYVMAKLRREGNLPYQRTHQLARGWHVETQASEWEGVMRVYNDVPSAVFVQGDYVQPFHVDTGWPQAAPILVKYEERIMRDIVIAWHTLAQVKG